MTMISNSPDEYNHELAIFAAWLSACAYTQRVKQYLLGEWSFEHAEEFNYDFQLRRDSVAYTIAHKNNHIVVAIRGTPRGRDEWLSNFDVGLGTRHTGFSRAASDVHRNLHSYLYKHNLSEKTMLITGHSRGGAVANLLGQRVKKEYSYVYTFGAPRVSRSGLIDDHDLDNIFNIINLHDPVVHVPPFPFKRYGRDLAFSWLNRDPFFSHMIIETYIAWLSRENPPAYIPSQTLQRLLYK